MCRYNRHMPVPPALQQLIGPVGIYTLFWFALSVLILLNSVANLYFFRKPRATIVANDQLPFISV